MRIDAGRLVVEADASGRIVRVTLRDDPDRAFLTVVELGACTAEGSDLIWSGREVVVDADEIGIRVNTAELAAELRHSFDAGWTTRLRISNPGTAPRTIDRLELTAVPAPGQRVTALAAGSRLCWASQSADGAAPILAARLGAGAISRVTDRGFELGPLRLAPGQRYVVQLRWELEATPRSVVLGPGSEVLLARMVYEVGEAVPLPEDPDAAIVVPVAVTVESVEEPQLGGRELSVAAPGRHRVELRSADGDVRLDLAWVRPLTEQLGIWAADVLAGPRSAAGVVVLADLPTAVVVQAALGAGVLNDADQAADALDRLTALLLDRDPDAERDVAGDPLAVLYLLSEHARCGEEDVLAVGLSQLAASLAENGPPPPGLGLSVLRTVLAGVDAQHRVAPLLRRATERVSATRQAGRRQGDDLGADFTEPDKLAAELELLLAVLPLLPADHPAHARALALVRALGSALGAGMPGRLVAPPPVAEHAHLVAVLRMLPEGGVPGATRGWGTSPGLLAHRLTMEVLDRLTNREPEPADDPRVVAVAPAAAWLALAHRPA